MVFKKFAKRLIEGYKISKIISQIRSGYFPLLLMFSSQFFKKEEPKKTEEIEFEGTNIPLELEKILVKRKEIERIAKKKVKLVYPVVPLSPKKGEKILAFVKIHWNKDIHSYIYEVHEPKLTQRLKKILEIIKRNLEEKAEEIVENPEKKIISLAEKIISNFKFKLTKEEKSILFYYLKRDFLGFGKIDVLMKDPNIEDISCDGPNIPIYIIHKDPRIGSIQTNIVFKDPKELDSFVIRLAQLCGKNLSIATPLVDGSLPDGSRLQATLASDVSPKGSNFTIRKFAKIPLTPVHLILSKTIDFKTLAFLWFCVEYGRNILIAGGTGTGKTTLLNILALFIPPEKKVVTIEETPELKLLHPHWVSHIARVPISYEKKVGEVDLFDLLRESFRQRPDYVIVGEVRGKEAYILFQQMASGHSGLSTIHSEDITKLIDRLKTPPISLPPSLLEVLDLIIFLKRIKYKGEFVRKVFNIYEIISVDPKTSKVKYNELLVWDAIKDEFKLKAKSYTLKKVAQYYGISEKEIREELINRMKVLYWLVVKEITSFEKFYEVVKRYYSDKERLLEEIEGEISEVV